MTHPGRWYASGKAQRLVHLTNNKAAAGIDATGELRGGIYAGPLSNAGESGLGVTWRTGLPRGAYQAAVPIPEAAAGAFSKPVPIGLFTGWQRAMGTQYTARGVLNLSTGAFTRTGINWTQVGWYGLDIVVDAGVIYLGTRAANNGQGGGQ